MEQPQQEVLTPEQIEAEEEALEAEKTPQEELRESIVSEYGFTEEDDAEKIDKLTEERLSSIKTKASLTRQKQTWREKAQQQTPPREEEKPEEGKPADPPTEEQLPNVAEEVAKALEERDLDDLDYPEGLKAEIKNVAGYHKSTIKKALSDPYIVAKIEEYDREKATEEAAVEKTNKTGGKSQKYSPDDIPDFDMKTKEGRDEYDKWKAEMIKQNP